jgi:hypothetical protein
MKGEKILEGLNKFLGIGSLPLLLDDFCSYNLN